MVINRKELARTKVEKIKAGYSAFAETTEVIQLILKELEQLGIEVHVDQTEIGTWFIPKKK